MSGIDLSVIYQARKSITAANVHLVNTWIFLYEHSTPQSSDRERYEKLLRKFVNACRWSTAATVVAIDAPRPAT
jgi:hypothetical protein